ncbi:hypothetical protein PGT21_030665 [Puccinia graminis f. sp. tritici]|uniref:Uncharacterized protein n=1 Tax=Puccinia graminis f. sp. tritici TaxID=56615 RepID=A0A5B0PJT8_PUCGR|nr:hypothetical protein PGT21_030665 [Puccinia graminis f. sp. tritici]
MWQHPWFNRISSSHQLPSHLPAQLKYQLIHLTNSTSSTQLHTISNNSDPSLPNSEPSQPNSKASQHNSKASQLNSQPSHISHNPNNNNNAPNSLIRPKLLYSNKNTRSSSIKLSTTKQNSKYKKRKASRSSPTKKNLSRNRSCVNQEQDDDEEEPEEEEEREEEDEPEEEQPDPEDQLDQEEEQEEEEQEEEESINLTLENFQTQLGSWSINKLCEVLGKSKKSCSNRVQPEVQDALLLLQQNYIKRKLMLSIIGNISETTTAKYLVISEQTPFPPKEKEVFSPPIFQFFSKITCSYDNENEDKDELAKITPTQEEEELYQPLYD